MAIEGLFGFWKFPVLNKLIRQKSIKDHKVVTDPYEPAYVGKPNYINKYTIKVTGDDTPYILEWAYDTKIRIRTFRVSDHVLVNDYTDPTGFKKGTWYYMSVIPQLKSMNLYWLFEQVEPR